MLDEFNKANAKIALLCNHQKKVSSSLDDQIEKLEKKIKELKNPKEIL